MAHDLTHYRPPITPDTPLWSDSLAVHSMAAYSVGVQVCYKLLCCHRLWRVPLYLESVLSRRKPPTAQTKTKVPLHILASAR